MANHCSKFDKKTLNGVTKGLIQLNNKYVGKALDLSSLAPERRSQVIGGFHLL